MTAGEIAELLMDDNIAAARWKSLNDESESGSERPRDAYEAAVMVLDVVAELAQWWGGGHRQAHERVRRCLDRR
jgi:hypothetical protein